MESENLDAKDIEILNALKDDAKQSVFRLSKKTRIPPTTIHNRIVKLQG